MSKIDICTNLKNNISVKLDTETLSKSGNFELTTEMTIWTHLRLPLGATDQWARQILVFPTSNLETWGSREIPNHRELWPNIEVNRRAHRWFKSGITGGQTGMDPHQVHHLVGQSVLLIILQRVASDQLVNPS